MTAITGSDTYFTNINSTFTAAKWEGCIDQAVDAINACLQENDELPNMTGTAGSKTLTVSSRQAGWIRAVTVAVYAQTINAGATSKSKSIPGLSTSSSTSSSSSSGNVQELAQKAANALKEIQVLTG